MERELRESENAGSFQVKYRDGAAVDVELQYEELLLIMPRELAGRVRALDLGATAPLLPRAALGATDLQLQVLLPTVGQMAVADYPSQKF